MTRIISDSHYSLPFSEPELQVKSPVTKKHSHTAVLKKIELLKEKVYEERPILAKIMQFYGEKSLFEFSKSYSRTNFGFKNEKRKKEFISVFKKEVARLLGQKVAKSAAKQISRYYTVSTAEHNAPLIHPNYLNANLISSLPLLDPIDPDLQNIFTLACANISFDNYAFPRGISSTSLKTGTTENKQLVFFPRSARPCPVVNYPAYTKEAIENAKERLHEWVREGSITKEDQEKLLSLIDEVYAAENVLDSTYYTEQITKTNFLLWKKLFAGSNTKAPNMVFLEQENIVIKLLLKHHMNKKTAIGKLLFDTTYHKLFLKHFNTVSNAFDLEKKAGTIFFWALPPGKKYREQLWYANGVLTNDAGDYTIKLNPARLKKALQNHELIPSTALSFILLSFYYGLRLRGAFEQTTYLTKMKSSYIALLKKVGDTEGIEDCINTPTTTLSFIRPIFAFADHPDGTSIPVGTLDLLFYGCEHYIYQIKEMAKKITLNQAVTRVLPLIYKRIYPENVRDEALASVSEKDIDHVLGIDTHIVSLVTLPTTEA